MFFLPMKKKLEDNKDTEISEQTDHIQAKTIKSKLQSIIRLMEFTRGKNIFIELNRKGMTDLTQFVWGIQKNLEDLISKWDNMIKGLSLTYL